MILQYDSRADVLYLTFVETKEPCFYTEVDEGIVLRTSKKSGVVHGCTIAYFLARSKLAPIEIDALGKIEARLPEALNV